MADNKNDEFIQILLERIEKDDLPTNVFDVEETDPLVLLGKMNQIIGQLENFQSTVNTSNTTANEALSKAEDAVDTSGQALSNANTALGTANQAIGTANTAIETANQSLESAQEAEDVAGQALSNSNTALNTANTAIDTANTALGTANTALSTSQSANATSSQALDTANNANATANSALESAETANTTAETAKNISETANQNSNQAVTSANEAKGIAETANQNSNQAVTTANEAKSTAEEALDQVIGGLGTKVYRGSLLLSSLDIEPIEDDITALQSGKVDKVAGKQLSTEDFTTAEKNKLAGLNNYDDTQVKADITDLQTADGQNVKLTGNQNIEGLKRFKSSIGLYSQTKNSTISLLEGTGDLLFSSNAKFPDIPFANNLKIVQSKFNSTNGYVRFAEGTQICFGVHSDSTGDKTVTLPYPFADTKYFVVWGSESDNGQTVSVRMISARNRTTSTFVNRFVSGNPMMYIAIGKWRN